MKTLSLALIVSVAGLALAAAPAEAARKGKKKPAPAFQLHVHQGPSGMVAYRSGGVRPGPLYNGPDYIGDDPDPSIRAYLIKDMTRYQGSY
ncbi:MAG: hypothetical protein QOF09_1252 [Alphaproteobacteria bacterium]|jgi:hypothetical protein|nr:hypothetical protein [Alphaproteobacteria bacterium]